MPHRGIPTTSHLLSSLLLSFSAISAALLEASSCTPGTLGTAQAALGLQPTCKGGRVPSSGMTCCQEGLVPRKYTQGSRHPLLAPVPGSCRPYPGALLACQPPVLLSCTSLQLGFLQPEGRRKGQSQEKLFKGVWPRDTKSCQMAHGKPALGCLAPENLAGTHLQLKHQHQGSICADTFFRHRVKVWPVLPEVTALERCMLICD